MKNSLYHCLIGVIILMPMKSVAMAEPSLIVQVINRIFSLSDKTRVFRQCYGPYGCFRLDHPWFSSHRILPMVPKGPREIRPKFFLFTRANPKSMQLLVEGRPSSVRRSNFDSNKMTFLITHGYLEHGRKPWLLDMRDELLAHGDHNVIILDWLSGSGPPYTQAAANIRVIGAMTAAFLAFLVDVSRMPDLLHLHMVGHSLGAHLCGYVGSHLRKKFGLELGRITGLDPAEPHFEWAHEITRLDASDAYFVDIIHTDGNPLMKMGLGMYQACGHLDFYPNGGKVMAGCDGTFANSLAQENGSLPYTLRRMIGCNHIRAYEYFIESINSKCDFIAVECPSWEQFANGDCNGCLSDGDPYACDYMGLNAFSTKNGSRPKAEKREMYLLTEDKKPFCADHYRVTIVLSDTKKSMKQGGDRGNFYLTLHGDHGSSTRLLLNLQEAFFEPGRIYHFMSITRAIGHVHSADLVWEYSYHPLNPLTWRILSQSKMFVNRVDVEKFGHGKKHTFCAQDKPFSPGTPRRVVWMPSCRDNKPDPGATFLGAVLNADPVGTTQMVIDAVNPLNMNPLNGLANIGTAFGGFQAGVLSASASLRRMGSTIARMATSF